MKSLRLHLVFVLLALGQSTFSQNPLLPDVDVYTLYGGRLNAAHLLKDQQPAVLVFWNSNDPKSLEQLMTLNEEYDSSLKMKSVKVIGICTGYSGTMESIRPLVNGIGLDFEVYIDRNSDLKRAMSVPDVPYTLVINPGKNALRYLGYSANINEMISSSMGESLAKTTATRK